MRTVILFLTCSLMVLFFSSGCKLTPKSSQTGNICVEISEDYGEYSGMGQQLLIPERTKALLQYLGFSSEKSDAKPCDGTLTIKVTGRPLFYKYSDSLPHYTGAEVTIAIRLTVADTVAYEETLKEKILPDKDIRASDTATLAPYSAPMLELVESTNYYPAIALALGDLFGRKLLTDALKDNRPMWIQNGARKLPFVPMQYVDAALKQLPEDSAK